MAPDPRPARRLVQTPGSAFTRGDRSGFGRWFWTIDKTLLLLILALVAAGISAVFAASPAAARRLSGNNLRYDDMHFVYRQLLWVAAGVPLMLATSMISHRNLRRLAVAGTLLCLLALVLVPFVGGGTNGSARWIPIMGFQFQPSEFFKPCFIVTTAWLLSLKLEDASLPTMQISAALLAMALICLISQPDVGQSALIATVWLVQAMLAGLSLTIIALLAGLGLAALVGAYFTLGHFADRVDKFLFNSGDTSQIEKALNCFRAGGLFGTGPGEGRMKFKLPEAQTDYIFSVIGEEFGMIACAMLAGMFLALVLRALLLAMEEEDPFIFLATSGLAVQFGLQAMINMMVNIKLLPSKGMTLPFISHGGSSFLAVSIGMGMLLAFTRCNPFLKGRPWARGALPA